MQVGKPYKEPLVNEKRLDKLQSLMRYMETDEFDHTDMFVAYAEGDFEETFALMDMTIHALSEYIQTQRRSLRNNG